MKFANKYLKEFSDIILKFDLKEIENIIFALKKIKKNAKYCFVLPDVNRDFLTPFAETSQTVIWHLIVSHPSLKLNKTKW